MFLRILALFVLVLNCQILSAQEKNVRQHEQLRKIREDMFSAEKKIQAGKKKESAILFQLHSFDLDIDMMRSVIHRSKTGQVKKARQIKGIEKNLKETSKELERLKQQLARRLIYGYKYGRTQELDLLLTARSVNDGLLWLEYQKRLAAHDHRNYLKIKRKQAEIIRDRDLLAIELQEKKKLVSEKIVEENKLKSKKRQRQKVLVTVRQDINLLRQQLADKQKAAEEIRRAIVRLQQQPSQTPLLRPGTPFAALKGRMLWPAGGKIVTRFGKYKHPVLKTVTENIGIDIQSPLGSSVQVVAAGKVTVITWQRGQGRIVIVSHYGGYYSVYTHLQEIYVGEMEDVQMGQAIGSVGDSGSLMGAILHFEIWQGAEKLNPEVWLGKS